MRYRQGNDGACPRVTTVVNIDIWSDVACPWCYIGKRRFDRALASFPHRDDITVTWHSYQLDPTLPAHDPRSEAEYLSAVKGMPVDRVREMFGHVSTQAAGEGLHYDFDTLVVANSMRAHQLIQLARETDEKNSVKGAEEGPEEGTEKDARSREASTVERLEEALFAAHFEQGKNIGDTGTLVALAVESGLDEDEVRQELESGSRIPAVQADVSRAASLGLNSVPTFVLDMKYAVPGAQPTEVFTRALEQAWEESHPQKPSFVSVNGAGDAEACGPSGC